MSQDVVTIADGPDINFDHVDATFYGVLDTGKRILRCAAPDGSVRDHNERLARRQPLINCDLSTNCMRSQKQHKC